MLPRPCIFLYNDYMPTLPNDTEKYLQKVSQCLYDMKAIIEAYEIEPIEDSKSLYKFYLIEQEKLSELLDSKTVPLTIKTPDMFSADFLLDKKITESIKKTIREILDYTRKGLGEVEFKRTHNSVPTSAIHTGVEEGELKDYLEKFLSEKKSKINLEKISNKLNTFKLKSLKNENDFFNDFEDAGLITFKEYGQFKLFINNEVTYESKKTFKLEPQLWKLLHIFLEHPNKMLNLDFIIYLLDNQKAVTTNSYKKYISKLQKVLKSETKKLWIENQRGSEGTSGWLFKL